jgi:putative spermidine/putrescine transport system permease protein
VIRRHPVLAGVSVVALLFLVGPIVLVIGMAFTGGESIDFPPRGLSLRWFDKALSYRPFLDALGTSLVVAALSTVFALVLGIPVALAVQRHRFAGRGAVATVFLLPVIVPEIVVGFALFQYVMVHLRVTAFGALLLGHTVLLLPYAVRVTSASLAMSGPALEEAARGLGAGPVRAFLRVTLPVMRPGIVAAAILSLITSLNNVPLSLLLSGPGTVTFPVELLHYVEFSFDPVGAAVSTLLLAATVVVAFVTERLVGFNRVFGQ